MIGLISNIGMLLGIASFILAGGTVVLFFGACATSDTPDCQSYINAMKAFRILSSILFVVILLDMFVPSHQTVVLIAASEVGEKLLKMDEVKDTLNPSLILLKKYIEVETSKLDTDLQKIIANKKKD